MAYVFLTQMPLTRCRYEDLVENPETEARRLFGRMGLELPEEVPHFISTHSGRHFAGPATLRPETTLQPSTAAAREPLNTRPQSTPRPSIKHYRGFPWPLWWTKKPSTTTPEPASTTEPAIQPDVSDYFGTVRDASFDGLQWLEELPAAQRQRVETECDDVLEGLNYPLTYPKETQGDWKTMAQPNLRTA